MKKNEIPKIAVLMATYNGVQWLSEQLESILNQSSVVVKLIVSDDMSSDGTNKLLDHFAKNDHRITLLPFKGKFGSAAKNFYRLIIDADISDCDYVAFADQDDIWLKNKLSTQVKIANESGADGVSSNVVAFWRDGSRALVDKSKPLRRLDFIFESAGPGSTYLMTPWLIQQVKTVLIDQYSNVNQIKAHDWLVYAVCRSSGKKWYISPVPKVKYRQHDNNELGVNLGLRARWSRLQRMHSGWYKAEVIKICKVSQQLTVENFVQEACSEIMDMGLDRFKLFKFINQSRRAFTDRIVLGLAILFFVF